MSRGKHKVCYKVRWRFAEIQQHVFVRKASGSPAVAREPLPLRGLLRGAAAVPGWPKQGRPDAQPEGAAAWVSACCRIPPRFSDTPNSFLLSYFPPEAILAAR